MAGRFPPEMLSKASDLQRCILPVCRHHESMREIGEMQNHVVNHTMASAVPSGSSNGELEAAHTRMGDALYEDAKLASVVFMQAANDILVAHDTLSKNRFRRLLAHQSAKLPLLMPSTDANTLLSTNKRTSPGQCRPFKDLPGARAHQVVAAARLCLAFADANKAALRQFEADYISFTGNARRAAMMVQPCFRKSYLGAFLCSPLLLEMQAIVMLHKNDLPGEKEDGSGRMRGHRSPRALKGRRWSAPSRSPTSSPSRGESGVPSRSSTRRSSCTNDGAPMPSGRTNNINASSASFSGSSSSSLGSSSDTSAAIGTIGKSLTSQAIEAEFWQAVFTDTAYEPQTTCSICLESLFRPAGLSCGHVFCKTCLHSSLQSSGSKVPPDGLHLGDPAVQSVAASCPECRQTSRLGNAAPMRCLEGLTQSLCSPEDWEEQRERHREAMAKLERDERAWNSKGNRAGHKYPHATEFSTPVIANMMPPPMAFGMGGPGGIMFF